MSSIQERKALIALVKARLKNTRSETHQTPIPNNRPYEFIIVVSQTKINVHPELFVIPVIADQGIICFMLNEFETMQLVVPISPELTDARVDTRELTDQEIEELDEIYFRALQAFFDQTASTE